MKMTQTVMQAQKEVTVFLEIVIFKTLEFLQKFVVFPL